MKAILDLLQRFLAWLAPTDEAGEFDAPPYLPPLVTAGQLQAIYNCAPALAGLFAAHLNVAMRRFGILEPREVAMFLAQLGHETGRLARMRENLNYSAEGLAMTWPSRYRGPDGGPNALARALHRKPEAIANTTYARRLGNGPEESGDGWRYRGGGGLMLTGRDNYTRCAAATGLALVSNPELIEAPEHAATTAAWYWWANGLSGISDFRENTRRINGGLIGYEDRLALYEKALAVLDVENVA